MITWAKSPRDMTLVRAKLSDAGLVVSDIQWTELTNSKGETYYSCAHPVLGGWTIAPVNGRWKMRCGNGRPDCYYNKLESAMDYANDWRKGMIASLIDVEQNRAET
jgi:hypothetical protein